MLCMLLYIYDTSDAEDEENLYYFIFLSKNMKQPNSEN
ncbi:hypothetical protein T09_3118 [Trichinella sp. T9]|nr:hypothetical protein T09_3118 [Trichinella sp. T9]